MTLQPRHHRALGWIAVSLILGWIYTLWSPGSTPAVVAPSSDSVALAERRLAKLRETAATVPAKEEIFKNVSSELAAREKGLIAADTAAQAQAQLVQIARRLGAAEAPPVEIRPAELGAIRPLGDAYGEVSLAVQMDCRIDQLVNILAGLSAQPELISAGDMRVVSSNAKDKVVGVRLTISGVVPKRLVPEKAKPNTGGAAF